MPQDNEKGKTYERSRDCQHEIFEKYEYKNQQCYTEKRDFTSFQVKEVINEQNNM